MNICCRNNRIFLNFNLESLVPNLCKTIIYQPAFRIADEIIEENRYFLNIYT